LHSQIHDYTKPWVKDASRENFEKLRRDYKEICVDHNALTNFIDLRRSRGNFFKDQAGNTFLDLAQGHWNPLGYNHRALLGLTEGPAMDAGIVNSANSAQFPAHDLGMQIRECLWPIKPEGLTEVQFTPNGSQAIETAIKMAYLKRLEDEGSLRNVSFSELSESDYENKESKLRVVTFENSNHVKTLAGLNASSGGLGKLGLPMHKWPVLPFPELQYPIHKHEAENRAEEDRCIANVRAELEEGNVAAVVVEPITFSGGKMATPTFFRELRELARKFNVSMIVDETRTGMGITGKNWGHDHWYLEDAPDLVAFGGATQVAGVFSTNDYRPLTPGKLTT
jgi:4-aminobutyrate aminotransferase/(S)-3-amino-2-methylpropionate transaminase